MPVMEVKIIPLGTKTASLSEYIVSAVKVLKQRNVKYQLTPVGTIIEADSVEILFSLAGEMHKATLAHVDRVVTFVELDERKDKKLTIASKLESAQNKLYAEDV